MLWALRNLIHISRVAVVYTWYWSLAVKAASVARLRCCRRAKLEVRCSCEHAFIICHGTPTCLDALLFIMSGCSAAMPLLSQAHISLRPVALRRSVVDKYFRTNLQWVQFRGDTHIVRGCGQLVIFMFSGML